jgi:hypothetical protein
MFVFYIITVCYHLPSTLPPLLLLLLCGFACSCSCSALLLLLLLPAAS